MVRVQTLPQASRSYYAAQRAQQESALAAVQRQWSRLSVREVAASWDALAPTLLAVVLTAQRRVAAPGAQYVDDVLAETGGSVDPFVDASPAPLVGYAGDGRPVEGLLSEAPRKTLDALSVGLPPLVARQAGGRFLDFAVSSVLSDTARASEKLSMASRPNVNYVRMLTPPSCSRCVVLAGGIYKSSVAFQRHTPGCDCRHIPAAESVAGDLTVDPDAYFKSLDAAEQERVFTKAGAVAIREGADVGRVVNARRGMTTAAQNQRGWIAKGRLVPTRAYGRDLYLTTESTTRRGFASRAATGRKGPRLMPESIVEIAEDRADLVRLLRANGYVS